MRPVLLDISCLCDSHTDQALDFIAKAIGEDPASIWDAHPNPYIRSIIELASKRGAARFTGMDAELQKWLSGQMHVSMERPARPPGAMARWAPAELELVKAYLQSIPPAEFTLDDWMMLVDYIVQRYLPDDDMRTEAQWLATRSNMMGRVQASLAVAATGSQIDRLLAALPPSAAAAEHAFGLALAQKASLDYGAARCVENVVNFKDSVRHRMRRLIMDYSEARFTGDKAAAYGSLQTKLLDELGTQNRDWRRIAVTEAGENMNQGFVASMTPGTRLRRVEKYRGACAFCRSIDGKVVTVVAADAAKKDGDNQIWVGKTNIGRSAAPRKRENDRLVDREPKEMYWIAAGVQHPHCRGAWVKLAEPKRKLDPAFAAWMDEVLGRAA